MGRSSSLKTRRGVYPGSFNPPTTAHLAIAEAAQRHHQLDEVHLVLSHRPLDKESVNRPTLAERVAVVEASVAHLEWARVAVTEDQLLADIAAEFDVLVMGADKWDQLHELRYYDSDAHMQVALAALPTVAVAPRHEPEVPIPDEARLPIASTMAKVSSSRARAGESSLMTPAAQAWAHANGGWPQ